MTELLSSAPRSVSIAERLGYGDEIAELERRYAAGEITNREVAERDAAHYRGRTLSELKQILESVPIIDGAESTFLALRQRGFRIVISTVTWSFAARILAQRWGLDAWSGCEMNATKGRLSGSVRRHFDEFDKREFVRAYCGKAGMTMAETVAVGDSRSDIPLFESVGFSIAVNPSPAARKAATYALETPRLTDVLKVIPGAIGA